MPKKDAIPTIYSVETQTTQQKFIVTYPYSECSIPENFLPIEFSQAPKEANKKCKKEISDTKKAIKEEQKQIYDRKMKLEKLKLLCRFCAAKNSTIDIKNFDEFEIDVVLLMLNLEMKVEYNNYLSDAVCEDCFNHIIGYTSFKGMCKAAEDRILEELESLVPENVPKEYKNEQESSPTREEMKEEYLDYISNTSEIAEEGDYPDQEDSMEVPKDDPDQEDTIEVPRDDPFEPDTPREIREIDLNDLDAIDENVLIEEVHYEIVSINQDQAEPTNISEKIENDDQVHNVIYEIKDIKPNPIIKNEATNQYVLKVYECVFCKKVSCQTNIIRHQQKMLFLL